MNYSAGILIALMLVFSGCRPAPVETDHRTADTTYSTVAPGQVDAQSKEVIRRMYLTLNEIPLGVYPREQVGAGVAAPAEETAAAVLPAAVAHGAEKCALEARRLMKTATQYSSRRTDILGQVATLCQEGLRQDPNMTRLHALAAEAFFNLSQDRAGLYHALRVVALNDDSLPGWQLLGSYHIKRLEYDLAQICYRRAQASSQATALNPLTLIIHMQLAAALTGAGYYQAAVGQYELALERIHVQQGSAQSEPEAGRLVYQEHVPLLLKADLYLKMGQIDRAVEALEAAQRQVRVNADLTGLFIVSLAEQKTPLQERFERVRVVCRYLLARQDRAAAALGFFYEACGKMSCYDLYLNQIRQWYDTEKWFDACLYARGLDMADRPEGAIEALESAMKKNALKGAAVEQARDMLGKLYAQMGRWTDMVTIYARLIDSQPERAADLWRQVEDRLQQADDLAGKVRGWLAQDSLLKSRGGCFLLAHLTEKTGMDSYAEDLYRRALEHAGGIQSARSGLVRLMLRQGRYAEVVDWVKQTPEDRVLLQSAGQACVELGRYDQARDYYQRLAEGDPRDLSSRLALADVQYRQGDLPQAEKTLMQVRFEWPDCREAYARLFVLYVCWADSPAAAEAFGRQCDQAARRMLNRYLLFYQKERDEVIVGAYEQLHQGLREIVKQPCRNYYVPLYICDLYLKQNQPDKTLEWIGPLQETYPGQLRVLQMAAGIYGQLKQHDQAAALYRKIWETQPENAQWLARAISSIRQAGEIEAALTLLRQEAEKEYARAVRFVELTAREARWLFHITRRYDDAVAFYTVWCGFLQESLAAGQEAAKPLYLEALGELIWSSVLAGQYDILEESVRRRIKLADPDKLYREVWAAYYLAARQDYDRALRLLDACSAVLPEQSEARSHYYQIMIDAGRAAEAVQKAQAWLAQAPDQVIRRSILLFVYRQTRQAEEAIELINTALQSVSDPVDLKLRLVHFQIMAGHYDDAGLLLGELESNKEIFGSWLDARIQLDIATGSWQKAFSRLDELTGVNADLIARTRVMILMQAGELNPAIEQQKKLLESRPDDFSYNLTLSTLYEKAGRTDDSLALMESLLKQNPDDPLLANNLGYSLIEHHRDLDHALELINKSLEKDPDSGATLDSLGWYYYKKGEFAQAYDLICQGAAYVGSMDVEVLDHLGDVSWRLDQGQAAGRYWQLALDALGRRLKLSSDEQNDKSLIENKLKSLSEGKIPPVTPLF